MPKEPTHSETRRALVRVEGGLSRAWQLVAAIVALVIFGWLAWVSSSLIEIKSNRYTSRDALMHEQLPGHGVMVERVEGVQEILVRLERKVDELVKAERDRE